MKNYPKCIDCGKELNDYQSKRCWNCYCLWIKIPENNPNYKEGITKKFIAKRKYGSFKDRSASKEYRRKLSEALLGHIAWNKGLTGSKSSSWIDGRSFEPYTEEFNSELKELIRKRDDYTCQKCGIKQEDYYRKLDIHHIDYNKFNCFEDNLITLCQKCNSEVNFNRDYWQRYFELKIIKKGGKRHASYISVFRK
jgi:hypothetical protein